MNDRDELEKLILKTLSLFDYYNLERIFIEFDDIELLKFPKITKPDLEQKLTELVANKKLCLKKVNDEYFWKKNFPQRKSIFHRFIYLISLKKSRSSSKYRE